MSPRQSRINPAVWIMDIRCPNNSAFTSYFESVPSVAASKILSYLTFQDKLNVVQIFTSWEEHLYTAEAWPSLVYFDCRSTRIRDRQEVCQCLRKYGKYIKKIRLNFHYHVRTSGTSLLRKVSTHCPHLQSIQLIEADFDADRPFKSIIDNCPSVKEISIVRPWVDWSHEENIVAIVTNPKYACKLTELVAVPETAYPEYDIGKALKPSYLSGLQTLKLKRSFLSDDIFLELTSLKLQHLSIFQDEELPMDQAIMYEEKTWQNVLKNRPNFCFHVALRNIILLRSSFPAQAPLRALILADLLASLTKGMLDTISEKYHSTLESFVCTKSFAYDTVDVEDRRLPGALVDLTQNCHKLHTLVYGFSISSTTVLLLAKCRKFLCLDIPLDTITYKFDWKNSMNWDSDFLRWLKDAGSTLDRLEEEVSDLQGYEWTISNEPRDRKIQHYFKYF